MSTLTSRPVVRWLVPAVAVVAVVGGGAAARTLSASAEPSLPERSAAQLLVDVQTAQHDGLSGTVVQRADLGLPTLPSGLGGQGSADLTSLVSGKHTLKVWYSGPDKGRVSLVGTNGQSDIIRNGTDVWFWNSEAKTASHRVLSGAEADGPGAHTPGDLPSGLPSGLPTSMPTTPQEVADLALKAVEPTTEVSTGSNARVADRPAYELVLKPKDKASLVGQIRIAIDATEHLPLRVQVYPKDSDIAALEVAFTQVSFARPDDGQFAFTPPPGVTVTEETGEADAAPGKDGAPGKDAPEGRPEDMRSTTVGEGWTTVFVTRTGAAPEKADPNAPKDADEQAIEGFLGGLPKVSGSWGSGTALTSRLFSVLMTDDGRLLVGMVTPERLGEVAGDPAAALK